MALLSFPPVIPSSPIYWPTFFTLSFSLSAPWARKEQSVGTGKSSTMLLPIFPCGRFISVPYVQNTNNTGALRLLIITVSTIASLLNYTFPSWKSWIFLCLVMYEFGPSLGQGSSLFCLGCAEPKAWLGRMHLSEEGRCVHASSASQKKAWGFMEAL